MTPEEEALAGIQQLIETLPPDKKALVTNCAATLRNIVAGNGAAGDLALALVGAEKAAQ